MHHYRKHIWHQIENRNSNLVVKLWSYFRINLFDNRMRQNTLSDQVGWQTCSKINWMLHFLNFLFIIHQVHSKVNKFKSHIYSKSLKAKKSKGTKSVKITYSLEGEMNLSLFTTLLQYIQGQWLSPVTWTKQNWPLW